MHERVITHRKLAVAVVLREARVLQRLSAYYTLVSPVTFVFALDGATVLNCMWRPESGRVPWKLLSRGTGFMRRTGLMSRTI
jgi:hypothetical protein